MNETVVVITGAAPLDRRAVEAVPAGATLVAADGGLDHALAAGLAPAVLIGDLDSVSPAGLAWATEHAEVERHAADKGETDTELAIAHAASLDPRRILLLAGRGDRLDHAIAALGSLGAPELARVGELDAWWGGDRLHVVHGPGKVELDLDPGTTFSVLAMHGRCRWRHRRGSALAARRPRPRAARRPRRQQRGCRPPRLRVGHHRNRHRRHPRRPHVKTHRAAVLGVLLASPLVACGDEGRGDGADSITLVAYDSFPTEDTSLNDGTRRSSRRTPASTSRSSSPATPGTMVYQGRAHRRQPRGRRDVRRRQHVPVAGASTATSSSRTRPDGARRRARTSCAPSSPTARPRRSTSATCASTTTSTGSTSTGSSRPRPRRPAEPAVRATCSSSRTRRPRRPASRSCWPPSPSSARTAGASYWAALRDNDVEVVDGWEEAYYERVHAGRAAGPAARRQLRHQPAGRGALRRPAASTEAPTAAVDDDVLPPGRVRRGPARHRARGRGRAARRLPRSASASRPSIPLNLFVYPANGDVALPDEFTEYAVLRRRPGDARPGHDRRQPGVLDRRVDRDSSCADSASGRGFVPNGIWVGSVPTVAGSRPESVLGGCCRSGRRAGHVPRRVLRLARAHRAGALAGRRASARRRGDRLVHAVAGRRQHHARRSPSASCPPTCSPASASRAGASSPALVTVPFVLPTVVVGAALLALLPAPSSAASGRSSSPTSRSTSPSSCASSARCGSTSPATSRRRPRTLGRVPWRVPREVTLPLLRPSILAAASVVFLFTFTSFGVVRVLGGAGHVDDRGRDLAAGHAARRLGAAAALAVVQLVVVALVVGWSAWQQRRTVGARRCARSPGAVRHDPAPSAGSSPSPPSPPPSSWSLPLAALVERSLRVRSGYSLSAWRTPRPDRDPARDQRRRRPGRRPADLACESPRSPLCWPWRSARSPTLAIVACSAAGGCSTPGLMLPIATSAVTIGFGMLITFDASPVDWRASWWIVPIGHALVAVPFVVRATLPVLARDRPRLHEAAATLGALAARAWREITVPHLRRPLVVAAGLALPRSHSASSGPRASSPAAAGDDADRHRPAARPPTGAVLQAQGYVLATILAVATIAIVLLLDLRRPFPAGAAAAPPCSKFVTSPSRSTARPSSRDASLSVGDAEVVALLGPSGSGKSTLLRVIAGLVVPASGSVHRRRAGHHPRPDSPPRHRHGVPGRAALPTSRRRGEHRLRAADAGDPSRGPRPAGRTRCSELVGLAGFGHRHVTDLSGGEAKRVALARSLAPRPAPAPRRAAHRARPRAARSARRRARAHPPPGVDDDAARHPRPRRGDHPGRPCGDDGRPPRRRVLDRRPHPRADAPVAGGRAAQRHAQPRARPRW